MNRLLLPTLLASAALLACASPAVAANGGVDPDQPASPGEQSGGAGYGAPLVTLPGKPRLSAQKLSSRTIKEGSRASVVVRINRSKGTSAQVRIAIARKGGKTINYSPGRVTTNRSRLIRLPKLAAGNYRVTVSIFGASAQEIIRGGVMRLTVKSKSVAKPKPKVPATPSPTSGVFPVRGTYSFGGDGARFGAGRPGHTHEGQDLVGNSGLPIVAPLAGEVRFVDYQAAGAGRYVVMRANNGWDMFFAHCQYSSAAVKAGDKVKAGDRLCLLGSTGASSGPHLHFEIWPNGWRDSPGTKPIDPLPQLKKWAAN
jgi:murein DD-endopeptidase MepM/ murein hydrolase activator NlpD